MNLNRNEIKAALHAKVVELAKALDMDASGVKTVAAHHQISISPVQSAVVDTFLRNEDERQHLIESVAEVRCVRLSVL